MTITLDPSAGAEPLTGLTTLPLDKLMLSNLNVRQTERDAGIAELAESISAIGLKTSLNVVPAHVVSGEPTDSQFNGEPAKSGGKAVWQDRFEVIGGGRRFQALRMLAEDGRLPADWLVPVMIEGRETARETSLAENLHRVAMNPADEFDAFKTIVNQNAAGDMAAGRGGAPAVAACAKRFGKPVSYVEGRLRLAALAPEILEALRTDKIGLEAAKAYCVTTDHKLQLQVFKTREKDTWNGHKPSTIREALNGKTLPLNDRRLLYVGRDAYIEAGGVIESTMFMGADDQERIVSISILDKLAKAKADEAIPALAKTDGFKEGHFGLPGAYGPTWPKPPKGFETAGYWEQEPSKSAKKKSIALYALNEDGTALERKGRFRPTGEQKEPSRGYTPPTPEQIAAAKREEGIDTLCARLAVGKFAGSPFEGRAFWPTSTRWIDAIQHVNDDEVLVAVLVKVSAADIEAQRDAAAAKYDEELAEAELEKARKASEAAAGEADALDGADAIGEIMDDDEADEVAQ